MDQLTKPAPDDLLTERLGFLANGGQTGQLLHALDSSTSPLGAPAGWSTALKTLMSTVLPVKAQIVLFWGPQYIALYNDAYAPSIGNKHPRALGRPAVENWSELWDDLEPLLRGVRETGETFSAKDRPFYIERHGRGEAVYFDVSYSAVRKPTARLAVCCAWSMKPLSACSSSAARPFCSNWARRCRRSVSRIRSRP